MWTDRYGEERYRCPRRPIYEDPAWFNSIITTYNAYKNGFLPQTGGMMDQACLLSEYMSVVEDAVNYCTEVEIDRQRRAQSRGGKNLL